MMMMMMLQPRRRSSFCSGVPWPASGSTGSTRPKPAPRWWADRTVPVFPPVTDTRPPALRSGSWRRGADGDAQPGESLLMLPLMMLLPPLQQHPSAFRGPRIAARPSFHYLSAAGPIMRTGPGRGDPEASMRSRFLSSRNGSSSVLALGVVGGFHSRLSPARFRQGRSEGDVWLSCCLHCCDVFQWRRPPLCAVSRRKPAGRRAQSIVTWLSCLLSPLALTPTLTNSRTRELAHARAQRPHVYILLVMRVIRQDVSIDVIERKNHLWSGLMEFCGIVSLIYILDVFMSFADTGVYWLTVQMPTEMSTMINWLTDSGKILIYWLNVCHKCRFILSHHWCLV